MIGVQPTIAGAGHRREPHAAGPENGDALPRPRRGGIENGAHPGSDRAAEQGRVDQRQ